MYKLDLEIYQQHFKNLTDLIRHFTNSDDRTIKVMKNLKEFLSDGTAIAGVHILDNKIVSFIWCYERNFNGSKRLHISYIIVHENYRGRGLSKELLNFAVKEAKEAEIKLIDLNVEPENTLAIKVYEKSGFNTEKLQLVREVNKDDSNV